MWHSHVAPASGAADAGAANADVDGGRRRFQRWHDDNKPAFFAALTTPLTTMPLLPRPRKERRVTVVQIGGPRDSLDDDAFIVPP